MTALRKQLKNKTTDPLLKAAAVQNFPITEPRQFVRIVAPLLEDKSRNVRIAATNRLLDLPRQLISSRYKQSLASAVDEYRAALELSQDRASGEMGLGDLARRQDNPVAAAKHFRKAIQLQPYLTGPRSELAAVLSDVPDGSYSEEVDQLRREEIANLKRDIELLPESSGAFYQLGLLYYLVEEMEAAENALIKAVELQPESYEFLTALALPAGAARQGKCRC